MTAQRAASAVATPAFSRTRETFICMNCDRTVKGTGYTNHCPACLWSRHVDVNPGDRASDCGAMMEPVGVLYERGTMIVLHRCGRCGHARPNRTAADDDADVLLGYMGRPVEWTRGGSRR